MTEELLPRPPRRPRPWQLILLVTVLGGAAVAITLFLSRRPEPLRVLVAIDVGGVWWRGSRASAALSSSLSTRLERLGFDAVRPGDPEVIAALAKEKTTAAAARRVRASFVVTAELTPALEDFSGKGGQIAARTAGQLLLQYRNESATSLGDVESGATGKTPDEASIALAESLDDAAFDLVFPALIGHATIRDVLERGDAAERGRLSRAKAYAEQRRAKLEEARRAYEKIARDRVSEERGPKPVTYYGAIDGDARLCGFGADGPLFKTDTPSLFFSPDSRELTQFFGLERVVLAKAGRKLEYFSSYGIHGYAATAPAGQPLVVVDDLFGWGRAVTVSSRDGDQRRIRTDVQHWPSDPKVAPGGALVALWERGCRGCPAAILVLATADGAERLRSDPNRATLGGFAWLDAKRLLVLERATEPKPATTEARDTAPDRQTKKTDLVPDPTGQKPVFAQTLSVLDFNQQPPRREVLYEARDEALSALAASRDGRFAALARRAEDGKELAVFDVGARSLATYTALAADNPALSSQGDFVVYERGGDIAVLERGTGVSHQLTNNPALERYPLFSSDDARVAFESRAQDPNFPRRTLSAIGTVPVR